MYLQRVKSMHSHMFMHLHVPLGNSDCSGIEMTVERMVTGWHGACLDGCLKLAAPLATYPCPFLATFPSIVVSVWVGGSAPPLSPLSPALFDRATTGLRAAQHPNVALPSRLGCVLRYALTMALHYCVTVFIKKMHSCETVPCLNFHLSAFVLLLLHFFVS